MAAGKNILLLTFLLWTSARSYENEGRKLFGGYRIVPKTCQPTLPSRRNTDEPAICMFNYECTRRNGEVVGACMDGFLFGACCQLPPRGGQNGPMEKLPNEELLELHVIDHVPEIPILLNPDGTPVGLQESTVKTGSNELNDETSYTKISTFSPTPKPGTPGYNNDIYQNAEKPQIPPQPDLSNFSENFSNLLGQHNVLNDLRLPVLLTNSENEIQDHQEESPVTTLLSPDQILQIADPVDQLPALFSQGLGHNNHSSAETILLNENGTLLNESNDPDDLFRPTTQSVRTTETKAATEKLGTEKTAESTLTSKAPLKEGSTQWIRFPDQSVTTEGTAEKSTMTRKPAITEALLKDDAQKSTISMLSNTDHFNRISTIRERVSTKNISAFEESTTPMSASSLKDEELVRVPTISNDVPSENKKDDMIDKEEMAINHIISILNDTTSGSDIIKAPSPPANGWTSDGKPLLKISTPKPSTTASFPYTFYKPSTYYNYETIPTESHSLPNTFSPRPSTQSTYGSSSSFAYSSRPTTNPPAPTVIVLGPLGTEYTTDSTDRTVTKKPTTASTRPSTHSSRPSTHTSRPSTHISRPSTRPGSVRPTTTRPVSVNTRKPSVSTTITHNISTVISNVATSNNHVVSTSFISVNMKDGTTRPNVDVEDKTTRRPTVWTTLSSWSDKPSFHLRPSTSKFPVNTGNPISAIYFKEPESVSTSSQPCDDETAAPDDHINFPPVRNPNLNISAPMSQQEKPTIVEAFNNTGYPDIEIISESDIPTPTFIEDDVLTNKVDAFVNKIVESLQGNFQDLKDIVYNRSNATTTTTSSTVTKRPAVTSASNVTTKKPVRRPTQPTSRPSQVTTKKPVTTKRPGTRPASSQKPSSARPKPTTSRPRPTATSQSVTTRRPQVSTTKRRPTRRPTTTTSSTETTEVEQESNVETETSLSSETTPIPSFRKQCGIRPLAKKARIVGGKTAEFGEWPWQVLVREATWLGLFTKNKCGGVLITDRFVITAAHCQPGFLASLVAVFGEHDISGEREERRSVSRNVRRVIVNRGYDPATFENDVALLELESPVEFDAHIVPICMPEDGADFTGRMATVTGWGRLKYNGGVPSVLQEVQVPIMENSVCQEMFQTAGHSKLILDSFLCAGYANGQKDSCEGDSGGPLVMERPDGRWFLVGTVSHGIKCAAPYLPGVYMRTTFFKPWLHSITGV